MRGKRADRGPRAQFLKKAAFALFAALPYGVLGPCFAAQNQRANFRRIFVEARARTRTPLYAGRPGVPRQDVIK